MTTPTLDNQVLKALLKTALLATRSQYSGSQFMFVYSTY